MGSLGSEGGQSARERERLARLLRERARSGEAYPLSHGQQALWLLHQLSPTSPAYNIRYAARINPVPDDAVLRQALLFLVWRHRSLRAAVRMRDDGEPEQYPTPAADVDFAVVDAAGMTEGQLHTAVDAASDEPFDPATGRLLRTRLYRGAPGGSVLLMVTHHLAVDFWSLELLVQDLVALCASDKGDALGTGDGSDTGYAEYVRWQRGLLGGPEGERHWQYWREQLAEMPGPLPLPTDRPREARRAFTGGTHDVELDPVLVNEFRRVARREGATLFQTVAAALFTLLFRYTGRSDLTIGTPTVGRSQTRFEPVVGYFVNPVVLRQGLSGKETVRELIRDVRRTVVAALEHQDFPFPLLVQRLRLTRDPHQSPLFGVELVWDRQRDAVRGDHAIALTTLAASQRGAPFDLTIRVFETSGGIQMTWQYSDELFDRQTVARMAGHFVTMLSGFVTDPGRRLADLPVLTAEEARRQVVDWNATAVEYPDAAATLAQGVEAQVRRTPDAVALVYGDRRLSYAELNRRANRLARLLRAHGVGPDTIVGVFMERSIELVVALLAVLKAGGAYLPLDPEHPAGRIALLLAHSGAPLVLTQGRLRPRLPAQGCAVLCADVEGPAEDSADLLALSTNDHLVYVMYTSGSTGAPKGVMVTGRGVVNRLRWMQQRYPLGAADRVLQKTPFSFDVSVWEFFWPLIVGARLVVPPPDVHRDPTALAELIVRERITTVHFVPSMLALFLDETRAAHCVSLRRVICSGEALPTALVERFFRTCGGELHNLYGPTEASIDVTAWRCRPGHQWPTTPIGRPIANTQVYVLDPTMAPAPVGVVGEIYIGGHGLARGYLGDATRTAECFVPDPFATVPGARLYRTGDLGSYLADGTIVFHGRVDHQVKINGNRVELGEIETTLVRHPSVAECAVLLVDGASAPARLVAHVVPQPTVEPNATELRHALAEHLPTFMVPAQFAFHTNLPHTVSGKLDRAAIRALPAPQPTPRPSATPPRSATEKVLADICRQVLDIEALDIDEDIFALGGASIQVLQVCQRARVEGLAVTPELVFRHPTVAALAAAVDDAEAAAVADPTMVDVRANPPSAAEGRAEAPAIAQAPPVPVVSGGNIVIESVGIYLPSRSVSSAEVLAACRDLDFPLERFTGIRSRRVVGPGESSLDLARNAARDCLASSRRRAEDIDLLICSSISRAEGSAIQFAVEPCMAAKLRRDMGLSNALAFDVGSACTGMFTGIYVAEAFIRARAARHAMVVSGEYITHLTRSAQHEIEDFLDSRLACLTLGDAGAAVIVEGSQQVETGFHHLDLFTLGEYAPYCIAKAGEGDHGGAIMYTDSVRLTEVAVSEAARYALAELADAGWPVDSFDQLIMHQTSSMSLRDARREINRLVGRTICHPGNAVDNLADRGNTASTSHFVALVDLIRDGRIQTGDRLVFGISGSGQTLGVGLYTMDDLPDRVGRWLHHGEPGGKRPVPPPRRRNARRRGAQDSVRVTAIGTVPEDCHGTGSRALARIAAERCIESSGVEPGDIRLLIHAGVYRDEFLFEPALAALLAGELGINAARGAWQRRKTLAFDVFDGALGFLDACQVATNAIRAGRCEHALIVASEAENNRHVPGEPLMGIAEVGGAVLLSRDTDPTEPGGFGDFATRYDGVHLAAYTVRSTWQPAGRFLDIDRHGDLEQHWIDAITALVAEFVAHEGLDLSAFRVVVPPQRSPAFIDRLAAALGIERDCMVDVTHPSGDLFTSSIPYGLQAARERFARPGDLALIIAAGSGLGVACASYRF